MYGLRVPETEFEDLRGPWPQRFEFFRAYGLPSSSPQARAAYKSLGFFDRIRVNQNFLAFLFGPFYFFVKGMWRKGLTLLVVAVAVAAVMVAIDVPDSIGRAAGMGVAAVAMITANYAYYLHIVGHSRSWNVFEGFGRRSADPQ